MPIEHALINQNGGGILAVRQAQTSQRQPVRYELWLVDAFDHSESVSLPGRANAIACIDDYLCVGVEVDQSHKADSDRHLLIVYTTVSSGTAQVKAHIEFENRIVSMYTASNQALCVQTTQGLFVIDTQGFEIAQELQMQEHASSIFVYELTEHYSKFNTEFSAGLLTCHRNHKSAALITQKCTIDVFERNGTGDRRTQLDIGASLGFVRNDQCELLAVDPASGRFVMATNGGAVHLCRLTHEMEPQLVKSQDLGPAIVSAFVDSSKVVALRKLGNSFTLYSAATNQNEFLSELPSDSESQSAFIQDQPALRVAELVEDKRFLNAKELWQNLQGHEQDVKAELKSLMVDMTQLTSDLKPSANHDALKAKTLSDLQTLDLRLHKILIVYEALFKYKKQIAYEHQRVSRSLQLRADDQQVISETQQDIQRIQRLKTLISKGLYTIIETNLVQDCRQQYYEYNVSQAQLPLLTELVHRTDGTIKDRLPFRSLADFVQLMESDRSSELEASLSVVLYHALLVSEVVLQYEVPQNLLNCEKRNAVSAVRNFDKLINRDHTDFQMNECLRTLINCNVDYVNTVSLMTLLMNKQLSHQCICLLQRKDFVDSAILKSTESEFDQFWNLAEKAYKDRPREWLAFMQMFETRLATRDFQRFALAHQLTIDAAVKSKLLASVLTVPLTQLQDRIIQAHLDERHPSQAIGKFLWNRQVNGAIARAAVQNSAVDQKLCGELIKSRHQLKQAAPNADAATGVDVDIDMTTSEEQACATEGCLSDFFFPNNDDADLAQAPETFLLQGNTEDTQAVMSPFVSLGAEAKERRSTDQQMESPSPASQLMSKWSHNK